MMYPVHHLLRCNSLPLPELHRRWTLLPAPTRSSLLHLKPPDSMLLSGANKDKPLGCDFGLTCNAISKANKHVVHTSMPLVVEDEIDKEALDEVIISNKIKKGVELIESMLESMEDGEISVSAYDTAWVAMIEDVHGNNTPQFPSCLRWIVDNQLPDGSWGDDHMFLAHDRLVNTLACIIALKLWNVHSQKCQKGISYVTQNICKLEYEKSEHMLIGFEVVFPSLLEMAKSLGIEIPSDSPVLQQIYAKRDLKLARIPKEMMNQVATTLLYSLEGMEGLDWERIVKLQCEEGSFLFSPSSTAYAFIHTKDENCLTYLTKLVQRFNGGVPNVYPVDLFERIWAVDRLQRLGISRYLRPQICECIDYVKRYWTEKGICWARNTNVEEIDDTAMAFRLLRLHGHQVSADVLLNFKKDREFCFDYGGMSSVGVTGMFNLYRTSQVAFPGEDILREVKQFAYKSLREKQASNELFDKWIIAKNLPGEVEYALHVPWYASLPRIETRFYLEQYGGEDDVWIGKTLYRMHNVNNNTYLEVAKQDYNSCQALHRREWDNVQKWYGEFKLGDFGVSKRTLLRAYFVATANIFEPERSKERLGWAKTAVLLEAICSFSDREATSSDEHRNTFVSEFLNRTDKYEDNIRANNARAYWDTTEVGNKRLVSILLTTINHMSTEQAMGQRLLHAWKDWIAKWEGDKYEGEAVLLVQTIILTSGHSSLLQEISHPHYKSFIALTNSVCYQLRLYHKGKVHDVNEDDDYNANMRSCMTTPEIERKMEQVVESVFDNSMNHIDPRIKHIALAVAKSFYYIAFFSESMINIHAAKVLFHKLG